MTVSPLVLHASPSAGVDEPMAMLAACHERVARMLVLLRRLTEHIERIGVDESARQAARDVMRYFDDAAPRHHDDEERHILPALRAQGQGALADRLAHEHVQMTAAWAALRVPLLALADEGQALPPGWRERCAAFDTLYRGHVAVEDHEAYPQAAAVLDAAAWRRMAADMAARRGLPPPS